MLNLTVLAAKVVHIDIAKINRTHSSIEKCDQIGSLVSQGAFYSTDILVGSPGQKISVDIDTGSGDLWILTSSTASST
jgi:hypothetical protein